MHRIWEYNLFVITVVNYHMSGNCIEGSAALIWVLLSGNAYITFRKLICILPDIQVPGNNHGLAYHGGNCFLSLHCNISCSHNSILMCCSHQYVVMLPKRGKATISVPKRWMIFHLEILPEEDKVDYNRIQITKITSIFSLNNVINLIM